MLIVTAKALLERNVQKSDSLFCSLKDSPEGAALAVLMDMPPASLKPFGFSQTIIGDIPCAVISDRKPSRLGAKNKVLNSRKQSQRKNSQRCCGESCKGREKI